MGVFHRATITPSKAALVAEWVSTQPWGPAPGSAIEPVGAFRFDDPENRVGLETHLVETDGRVLQVPVTYRDAPLDGAEDALITRMEHSVLGTRWVYDGLRDDRFVLMLAAVAMTGQGEALGMVENEGRWHIAPANVRINGGGWGLERVPIDNFEVESVDATTITFSNDGFTLTVFRHPSPGTPPPIGLTATWEGQASPVVLAEVRER